MQGYGNNTGGAAISKIVVLTGPESCGKTTLAEQLSEHTRAPLVTESSRDYLDQKISGDSHFRYSEIDLLEIASQQHKQETQALDSKPGLLICDTDLLVLIIWSEVRFGHCHPWILDTFRDTLGLYKRHYLLCDHDIPWEADALRENPSSRGELFELYRQKLEYFGLEYSVMTGSRDNRLHAAMALLASNTPFP